MRRTVTGLRDLFARTPVPYTTAAGTLPGLDLFGSGRSGRRAQMQAYSSLGTLFAIVNNLANGTSRVEWHLYRKRVDARRRYGPAQDDRTEITTHQALKVWNRPNAFMPRQEFVESTQQHTDLTGEGWWVVESVGEGRLTQSIPVGMWPVRPDRMRPVPSREEFISGYMYTGPDGEEVPLARTQVIMIRMPDPEDPFRGLGPVAAIQTDVDAARLAAEWNRNFFKNSALPGGIIEVDHELSEPQFQQLLRRWRESHKGVGNAHRVGILEQATWRDRQMSMRDMEFSKLRGISSEVIREAFSYPRFLLGEPEGSNRASAMAAEYVEARRLLVPRLERIKAALNFEYLPLFGATADGLEFDYDSPVPDDPEQEVTLLKGRVEALQMLLGLKADPHEACELVGLPPIEFGEPDPPPPVVVPAPAPGQDPMPMPDDPGDPGEHDDPEDVAAAVRRLLAGGRLERAVMNGHGRERIRS